MTTVMQQFGITAKELSEVMRLTLNKVSKDDRRDFDIGYIE